MSTQTTEVHRHFEWTIADRLRKAREEAERGNDQRGFTQQELAERIDVSQRTIANYESPAYQGKRKPLVVRQWAWATGYDYGLLMTGEVSDPDDGGTRADLGVHVTERERATTQSGRGLRLVTRTREAA